MNGIRQTEGRGKEEPAGWQGQSGRLLKARKSWSCLENGLLGPQGAPTYLVSILRAITKHQMILSKLLWMLEGKKANI